MTKNLGNDDNEFCYAYFFCFLLGFLLKSRKKIKQFSSDLKD